jgi:hypothetical protein
VLEFAIHIAQSDPNQLKKESNAALIEEFFLAALDLK